jgi:beta-galactosidase/beta-glucuronidase
VNAHRLLATTATVLAAVAGSIVATAAPAQAYVPKTPPLTTPWTNQVSRTNPLPEYPRPQLTRPDWQNLNGIWQFAGAPNINTPPVNTDLAEEALVPYPIESALSGIMRRENFMYYRRTFTVPTGWAGRNVQLNFGAVDWQSKVWINGDPYLYNLRVTLAGGDAVGGYFGMRSLARRCSAARCGPP